MPEILSIDTFRYTGPLTAASVSSFDVGPYSASNGIHSSIHCDSINYTNSVVLNLVVTKIILRMPFKKN